VYITRSRVQPVNVTHPHIHCKCSFSTTSVSTECSYTTGLGARRRDNIRPVLVNLHWLPVRKRVTFKTAVLVWKCLHDAAPCYLMDLCRPVTSADGRHLRSAHREHSLSRVLEQLSARGASPSMDRRRGIDFRRHSAHWSWRCLCLDADWRPICSSTVCLESSSSGAVVTVSVILAPSINQPTQLNSRMTVDGCLSKVRSLAAVVFVAASRDYYKRVQLVSSEDDYDSYANRLPQFLLSLKLRSADVPFRPYQASSMHALLYFPNVTLHSGLSK